MTEKAIPNAQSIGLSFEELGKLAIGTCVWDELLPEGCRFLVLRGGFALAAYLGIPATHPAAGTPLDELEVFMGVLRVHWGINFAEYGDGRIRPKGYYWLGWDYGHGHDAIMPMPSEKEINNSNDREIMAHLESNFEAIRKHFNAERRKWTVLEVVEDARPAMQNLI